MKKININSILNNIYENVESHKIETGNYARWLWQNEDNDRNLSTNAYGCADAANILYTLNLFPRDLKERELCIKNLQAIQDEKSGMFKEGTHHIIHTTAHCVAALELFDARPLYPMYDMEKYKNIDNLYDMLESIDWLHCGKGAHAGAGIYAAFAITGTVDEEWKNKYFKWFNEKCDSETGLWIKQPVRDFPVRLQIGDAFHYYFNYEHAKEQMPYPEKLIDSCLNAYKNGEMGESFGKQFHYIEMDWVYCLNRASHQTTYRFDEIKKTLFSFAEDYIEYLNNVDWKKDDGANDLHLLFGVICCLAELQRALPGKVYSAEPLRLVLDRRPFI